MACTKEFEMAPSGGAFYWGIYDSDIFQPEMINTADDTVFDTFVAALHTQSASQLPASPTKFLMDNPTNIVRFFFWFAYPDSFGELNATTGFRWAGGDVGAPTATVEKYNFNTQPTFNNDKRVVSANGFYPGGDIIFGELNWVDEPALNRIAPNVDTNGWAYWSRDIDGVSYRFYSFGCWIVEPTDTYPGNSTSRARASNISNVGFDTPVTNYPGPSQAGVVTFAGLGGTGYNVTQWAYGNFTDNWFVYFNSGSDEGTQADTGGTFVSASGMISSFTIGSSSDWGGYFPNTIDFPFDEFSLFVTGD